MADATHEVKVLALCARTGQPSGTQFLGPGPRLHPCHRLHGRRGGRSAGRTGQLRRRNQGSVRRSRALALPDAAPAQHALRDVRNQAACEASGLRRPAVDQTSHRQRERIFGSLLDLGPGVYVPDAADLAPQSTTNKQGRAGSYSKSDTSVLGRIIEETSRNRFRRLRRHDRRDGLQPFPEVARSSLR